MPDLTERMLRDSIDHLTGKIRKFRKGDPQAIPLIRLLAEANKDLEDYLKEKESRK